MSPAQRRNLEHVRDHGCAYPRSRSGHWCRINDLSEFLIRLPDGTEKTVSELGFGYIWPDGAKIIGERLTDAGRAALAAERDA